MSDLRTRIRRVPLVGPLALAVNRRLRHWAMWRFFPGSAADWRRHYEREGGSGCGSYGRLAEFKAEVIGRFVGERSIRSALELGCGDGNQLSLIDYPSYIGLDIARGAILRCKERFAGDTTKSFFLYDPLCFIDAQGVFRAELTLSLDVVFHLVEDELFELHMTHLFGSSTRFVIVYSSDKDERTAHPGIRHRKWTDWVATNAPAWSLRERIPNRYPDLGDARTGSFSDFHIYER